MTTVHSNSILLTTLQESSCRSIENFIHTHSSISKQIYKFHFKNSSQILTFEIQEITQKLKVVFWNIPIISRDAVSNNLISTCYYFIIIVVITIVSLQCSLKTAKKIAHKFLKRNYFNNKKFCLKIRQNPFSNKLLW